MAASCAASTAARAWEDVSKGIDYLDIHVIANFPDRNDRYYVASARGFFTSDKPEDGWARAENGMTRDYFHDFLFSIRERDGDPATMLIATADGSPGFWRRENRGARGAIFKSTDGAESWKSITNGLADDLDSMIWALVHHPTDHRFGFRRLRQCRPRPRLRRRRRRRSDDQPRPWAIAGSAWISSYQPIECCGQRRISERWRWRSKRSSRSNGSKRFELERLEHFERLERKMIEADDVK